MINNLPAVQETWISSLGREDSPWEGNGYPLQYSCLENPLDRGARKAAVHGVSKSQTRLSGYHVHSSHTIKARNVAMHSIFFSCQSYLNLKKLKFYVMIHNEIVMRSDGIDNTTPLHPCLAGLHSGTSLRRQLAEPIKNFIPFWVL